MAATPLIHYVGQVLLEAREDAGLSREWLAGQSQDGITTNTLFRFEKGRNASYWPRDPEAFVNLYAGATGLAPFDLWTEALRRWQTENPQAAGPRAAARSDAAAIEARLGNVRGGQKRTRTNRRRG